MNVFSVRTVWVVGSCLWLLSACNLEKEIEVPLPEYQSKLVVECYLEAGKPFRLAISESASYFDAPTIQDVRNAEVTITFNGVTKAIHYRPVVDTVYRKLYNYTSDTKVNYQPDTPYILSVNDPAGRRVTGTATFLPVVSLKEPEWRFNADSAAFLLIRFDDPLDTRNYYRIQVHRDSLNRNPDVDFTLDDTFSTAGEITLGTGYNYRKGDSLYVTLYHLEESYYNFLESVEDAARANGNPFAQPAQIKSAVQGGIGVFATLVYDRKKIMIE
jgi:hypothetical protein